MSEHRESKGKARRSRKNYSEGKIEGLVLFSLESHSLDGDSVVEKTPPFRAMLNIVEKVELENTSAGTNSFPGQG